MNWIKGIFHKSENKISVTSNNRKYIYSRLQWNFYWFLLFIMGFIIGIIVGLLISGISDF